MSQTLSTAFHQGLDEEPFEADGLMLNLPPVRGSLTPNAPLADQSWFRVGGPAEVLYKPADEEDLAFFLAHCPQDVPVTVLGVASNSLIRDGGIPGVVIKLGPSFARISVDENGFVAGAAALDLNVARTAENRGLKGFSFLAGIPGTVGGGLRMNAGAHGREYKDIVAFATALDRTGTKHIISNEEMGFSYRKCGVSPDFIFVSASFECEPGDPEELHAEMLAVQEQRKTTQPIREKTGGSTFANPADDPHAKGRSAWQLIDEAGCRGLRRGGARVSPKHCNFLINTGDATAQDIEELGEEVRRRVFDHCGVRLQWEIRRLGVPATDAPQGEN